MYFLYISFMKQAIPVSRLRRGQNNQGQTCKIPGLREWIRADCISRHVHCGPVELLDSTKPIMPSERKTLHYSVSSYILCFFAIASLSLPLFSRSDSPLWSVGSDVVGVWESCSEVDAGRRRVEWNCSCTNAADPPASVDAYWWVRYRPAMEPASGVD